MKHIVTKTKMDIFTAVEYGVDMIQSGTKAFFINTQFGLIPIEVYPSKPKLGDIGARKYRFARKTKFVIENYDNGCKWHVSINRVSTQPAILTRIQLIRSLSFILFNEISDINPSSAIITVLTDAYLHAYRDPAMWNDSDGFISAFSKLHCRIGSLIKSDSYDTLSQSVTKVITANVEICTIEESKYLESYHKAGYYTGCFGDYFYDMIAAIMTHRNIIHDFDEYKKVTSSINGGIDAIDLIKRLRIQASSL